MKPHRHRLPTLVIAACLFVATPLAGAQVAPRVTAVRSVADAAGKVEPDATLQVAVTQLLVGFSLPMFDPPGNQTLGDVDALASYRLVGAGANGEFETASCAVAPAGDDVTVVLLGANYSIERQVLSLDVAPVALARGRYRLLACDVLRDLTGLLLDGDGDGAPGGDFARNFSIAREHRLLNSSFNTGIGDWDIRNIGQPSASWSAQFDLRDGADAHSSGSLRVDVEPGASIQLYQCIATSAFPWTGELFPEPVVKTRVLSGSANLVADLWVSFGPETGSGCWGPGLPASALQASVDAGSTFATIGAPELRVPQLPYVNVTLRIVPLAAGTSVLLDDIQLGFGEAHFGDSFEVAR